ncbi:glycosyltransferase [Bacillus cereus]|nr:glycosyltransferase [Bacillus cereus]
MKKIVFFALNLGGGGAERVLVDLANLITKNYGDKYSVTVCTIFNGVLDNQLNQDVKFVKLINRDFSKRKSIINKLFFKFLCMGKGKLLRNLIDKKLNCKFDVEIAFLEGLPAKIVSMNVDENVIKIGWIHANLRKLDYTLKFFDNREHELETYNKLDELVFVSEECRKGYEEEFKEKHLKNRIIQNITDYQRIKELSQEKVGFEFPYICTVGRLSDEKGFDRLIEAYRNLLEKDILSGLKLVIVGNGKKEKELKTLVKEYGMQEDIIFVPFSENPYKYIEGCEFFVSSSRTEGYPLVVVEALVLGKPIMVTETGATAVVEDGKYGMVVENSTEGIEKGLIQMLERKIELQDMAIEGSLKIKDSNEKKIREIVDLI